MQAPMLRTWRGAKQVQTLVLVCRVFKALMLRPCAPRGGRRALLQRGRVLRTWRGAKLAQTLVLFFRVCKALMLRP